MSSFFILLTNFTIAQHYHFDNYSVKEGLAQSSVYTIQQDAKGLVWLGTASGLSKFDGKDFLNYTTENGLADGGVKTIFIDSTNSVWTGHIDGGVSRVINGKTEVVFNLKADVTGFGIDSENHLWISTFKEGAIEVLNPFHSNKDSIVFKQYKGQDGLSDVVYQVVPLQNGTVCFVTDVGVKQYNSQKAEFFNFSVKDMPYYFQITCMLETTNGDLWFGSYNGGLYHHQQATNQFKIYDYLRDGIAANWITTLTEDKHGAVWVGTWGGGLSKMSFNQIITISKENGLVDNNIRSLLIDREGNLLVGTKENGLLVFKGFQFLSYDNTNGLNDNQVWAIQTDAQQQYWVGTKEGISVFKKENNQLKIVQKYDEKNGLLYKDVRLIKKDKNNTLWIGTWGGGVVQFNSKSNRFEINYRINSFMSQPLITALEVDKSNNLWIGTTDGLVYYEINNQLADRLTQSHGLAGNDISCLFSDANNVLWVGSKGKGLTKIEGANIQKIKLEKNVTPISIVQDNKGNLWIGTEGKGVLVFDGKKIIKEYTVSNGLLSDYISLLVIDNKNNTWVGTNKGLNKLDVATGKIFTYTDKMGYKGIESKHNATFKDVDGNLWFGTIAGLIQLNINEQNKNELEPITQITQLLVNLEQRKMLPNMELNYREKSIVFHYKSICFTNPEAIHYKIMLEGIDEDWRPATQQTFVTYSPLPPGKYTFKVMASNNNGIWNAEPTTFSFEIIPPFWQQWWFVISCVLLVIISIVGVIKYREKALVKEKHVLEEKVKERTAEVVQKSEEIKMKNKDIIDSINYAKRIQDAVLPSEEEFTQSLKNTFVLFNPKDIVSGDFYWMYNISIITNEERLKQSIKKNELISSKSVDNQNNVGLIFFAAADCTGHGVPGAFMSIIGHNLLDKIVGEYNITNPAEILNQLNKGVSETLRQSAEQTNLKDGMDISLCVFNTQTKVLEFAGAYNPLYIVSEHIIEGVEVNMQSENGLKLYEIKADRFPIGSYTDEVKNFKLHTFQLQKRDTVYLFSDGYADQFGGPQGKKYRYKQFKELLLAINTQSMESQKETLQKEFEAWRGSLEQIDDVIIIGSRVG